jgi:hypothetical protein
MAMDKRSKSARVKEILEAIHAAQVQRRTNAIRLAIWGTYICQGLLLQESHDRGGLAAIIRHKMGLRSVMSGPGAPSGSALGWVPAFAPEVSAAALARPAALLASQRDRRLAASTQNLVASALSKLG